MSEPRTEAGRRLDHDGPCEYDHRAAILAIEDEARADLAARIIAAVEALLPAPEPGCVYLDAVLDAIRKESER